MAKFFLLLMWFNADGSFFATYPGGYYPDLTTCQQVVEEAKKQEMPPEVQGKVFVGKCIPDNSVDISRL